MIDKTYIWKIMYTGVGKITFELKVKKQTPWGPYSSDVNMRIYKDGEILAESRHLHAIKGAITLHDPDKRYYKGHPGGEIYTALCNAWDYTPPDRMITLAICNMNYFKDMELAWMTYKKEGIVKRLEFLRNACDKDISMEIHVKKIRLKEDYRGYFISYASDSKEYSYFLKDVHDEINTVAKKITVREKKGDRGTSGWIRTYYLCNNESFKKLSEVRADEIRWYRDKGIRENEELLEEKEYEIQFLTEHGISCLSRNPNPWKELGYYWAKMEGKRISFPKQTLPHKKEIPMPQAVNVHVVKTSTVEHSIIKCPFDIDLPNKN